MSEINIKDIIVRINKLSNKEQLHIFNILKTNDIKYSKNSNGYFFNFIDIKDDILYKIDKCLGLIESNTDLLKEMDRRRDELLLYYQKLINDKLNYNIKVKKDNYIKKLKVYDNKITSNIKRINKLRKRVLYEKDKDIDIVMKEYLKSKSRYKKDSVYYKINNKMKFKRTYDNKKNDIDDLHEIDEDNNLCESDLGSLKYDHESLKDPSDFMFSDENDLENVNDEIDNLFDDKIEEFSFDENNDEINDEINDETYEELNEYQKHKNTIDLEINYYMKLLNQKGFVFDDNKRCLLQIEKYIN
jgi:hypothetical protein